MFNETLEVDGGKSTSFWYWDAAEPAKKNYDSKPFFHSGK